ncbi:MAG: helix-turn-helix domain-containing protein [Chloroflexota bacterium]
MANVERYTLSYRSNEAHQVMAWVKAGQCGSIIGLRGAGKSILLHFLLREDIRQDYLGPNHNNFIFILLDLLGLIENSEWAVYELILSRVLGQLRQSGVEAAVVEEVNLLHREYIRNREAPIAHRTIEQCLDILCSQLGKQVILLFDEVDKVFETFDPSLFLFLRGLWNAHDGQLSYIIAVSKKVAELRGDLTEIDHFYRLIRSNICELGPLGEADAREMISHLTTSRSLELNEIQTKRLVELSGGHGGLIKAMLSLLWGKNYEGDLARLELAIKDEPVIEHECHKIWSGLSKSEQASLSFLVGENLGDPQALQRLTSRGLLRKADPPVVFSPLFAVFVQKQSPPSANGTYISRSPHIVQLDGQRIEGLTELEFSMLFYLYEHRGHVCTKDELIKNVYGQRYLNLQGGISDETLQALISRLREKIEPDRVRPRYVVTVRGEGYCFVDANAVDSDRSGSTFRE